MAGMRRQPHGRVQIDWSNPITLGLAFAFVPTLSGAMGWSVNTGVFKPYTNSSGGIVGKSIATPLGVGMQAVTANSYIIPSDTIPALASTNYSLFAVGACAANVTQMAIDDDAGGSLRKFQFRIDQGRANFAPFNTSSAIISSLYGSRVMTTAEMAAGFSLGATASPQAISVFQNGVKGASAAGTNIATPTGNFWIGCRKTSTSSPWAVGGLSLVAAWSRTLSDAEMQSLGANPWQLFLAADDYDETFVVPSGSAYTLTAAPGSFSLTAAAAGVYAGRKLQADQCALTLAATPVGLRTARRLAADQGALTMSSAAASLLLQRLLPTGTAGFALVGTSAALRASRKLVAQSAAFALSAGTVQMVYTPAPGLGGPAYTLTAAAGVFGLVGAATGLQAHRRLPANTGAFGWVGAAAILLAGRRLPATVGTFTVAGATAALRCARYMPTQLGTFNLVVADAQLRYSAQVAYARAPAGAGYAPRQHYNESRPAATSGSRPAALQRNNR